MFLFFLAQFPLAVLWFARPILRHCNLQTLVVAPTVFLLLLVPLFFPSKPKPTTAIGSQVGTGYRYSSSYPPVSSLTR